MAWPWSHTNEAYAHAREELERMAKEALAEIYAEWKAVEYDEYGSAEGFNEQVFEDRQNYALRTDVPNSELTEFIWERASEQATCDNGGFNAWMCPYGCGPHCVSFGPKA